MFLHGDSPFPIFVCTRTAGCYILTERKTGQQPDILTFQNSFPWRHMSFLCILRPTCQNHHFRFRWVTRKEEPLAMHQWQSLNYSCPFIYSLPCPFIYGLPCLSTHQLCQSNQIKEAGGDKYKLRATTQTTPEQRKYWEAFENRNLGYCMCECVNMCFWCCAGLFWNEPRLFVKVVRSTFATGRTGKLASYLLYFLSLFHLCLSRLLHNKLSSSIRSFGSLSFSIVILEC